MDIPFTLLIQPERTTSHLVSLWTIHTQAARHTQAAHVEKTAILEWSLLSSGKAFAEGIGDWALGIVDAHLGRRQSVGVSLTSKMLLQDLVFYKADTAPVVHTLLKKPAPLLPAAHLATLRRRMPASVASL